MREDAHLQGSIVSVTVKNCKETEAVVKYLDYNLPYHSEIHKSETEIVLTMEQAHYLAKNSVFESHE